MISFDDIKSELVEKRDGKSSKDKTTLFATGLKVEVGSRLVVSTMGNHVLSNQDRPPNPTVGTQTTVLR